VISPSLWKGLNYHFHINGALNIYAERRRPYKVNEFNDLLFVSYLQNQHWVEYKFKITTLPGRHWLTTLMNQRGTAILKPGQYLNAYRLGLHKGAPALVQCAPMTVYRDDDLDEDFDLGKQETGIFGINIHRASAFAHFVNSWSAGCQVFQSEKDFEFFMDLCMARAGLSAGRFNYTLFETGKL
jgi:hypothetical protein